MRPTLSLIAFVLPVVFMTACQPSRSIAPTPKLITTTVCDDPPDTVSPYVLAAEGYIYDIAMSDDGHVIAVTTPSGLYAYCIDGLVDAWHQPDSSHSHLRIQSWGLQFLDIALTPDRRFPQMKLIMRDANTGQVVEENIPENSDYSQSFGPGGAYPWDERIVPFILTTYGDLPVVSALSYDKSILAVGQPNGTIELWDLESQKRRDDLWDERANEGYAALGFSPDGGTLVAVHPGQGVTLWPVKRGKLVDNGSVYLGTAQDTLTEVAFSADRSTIALGADDGSITVWDAVTGARRGALEQPAYPYPAQLALSSDGSTLIVGDGYTLSTWDVVTERVISERAMPQPGEFVYSLSVHPDGKTLAAASDNNIDVWDIATHQKLQSIEAHTNVVRRVRFSPDGALLASASYDGKATVWDASTWEPRCTFEGHDTLVIALAWSPDGSIIATGDHAGNLLLWNPQTCTRVGKLRGHDDMVVDAAFSADGQYLATGSFDGTAALWDIQANQIVSHFKTDADIQAVEALVWQPGGEALALGLGGLAQVFTWSPVDQKQALVLEKTDIVGRAWVRSLAWSPDGVWLAAGIGSELWLLDAETRQTISLTEGAPYSEVWGLAWTPDGATLVTGTSDGVIMLWNAAQFGLR